MTAIAATSARSVEQRFEALAKANRIRSQRAALKRDLKAYRVALVPQLLDPPAYLDSMKVFDLLISTPKWGRVKAGKLLHRCKISPSKTVGGLSDRQRQELVTVVVREFSSLRAHPGLQRGGGRAR